MFRHKKNIYLYIVLLVAFLLLGGCGILINRKDVRENIINYTPDVEAEKGEMMRQDAHTDAPIKPWEKQFCIKNKNSCYKNSGGPTPPFPDSDVGGVGGVGCVVPYSKKCQQRAPNFPDSYYPCKKQKGDDVKEGFLDWSLYNPPISNGFSPDWWSLGPAGAYGAYGMPQLAYQNSLDRIYNPLRYPYRSEAFYEQGWYPNMILPPQVIGCGGRRQGCIGGTESTVPTVPPPIEISERNIAPVNIMTRGPQGIPQQVGLLYKIFGSLNEVYPLFGRRTYPNSDTWEYYTMIGTNRDLKVPVITKRKSSNELGTNDIVQIAGNSARFRTVVYQNDFPSYVPYF